MSEWFREELRDILNGIGLTFSEWRSIARLKANGWCILPGQRCRVYVGVDCDGSLYRIYYLEEIEAIVRKYDLNYDSYDVC